jgi:RNA polymerase sigma-70 factor (ECF subfamily)
MVPPHKKIISRSIQDAPARPGIAIWGRCNNFASQSVPCGEGTLRGEAATQASAEQRERFRAPAAAQLPRLYALARRLVGNDAEDAVQDCLLKAYRGYGRLGDETAAPAWLTSILVNCCRDRGRARARPPAEVDLESLDEFSLYRKIADEDPFPYSDSLHLDFLHQFGADDVRAILASLPGYYRIPLVLTYMDGWATKEVARMLNLPLGTVLAQLHRGRRLFEKRLWEYAETHGLLKEPIK